ncbi:MAG: hypothetical protein IJI58_02815 [Bacilli bacterium]|nr:hypothetical protein [Bacilli bacterium]
MENVETIKNAGETEEKKYILIKKEGRVVLKHIEPSIIKASEDEKLHLCAKNCEKFGVFTCPKIGDRHKKTIDKYDFITDGYQIYDDKKQLEEFKITGCTSYKKSKPTELTPEEKDRIKATRKIIMSTYFGTGTVEEARVQQYLGMIRGNLINAEEKVASDNVLLNSILAQPDAEILLEEVVEYKRKEISKDFLKEKKTNREKKQFTKETAALQKFEKALSGLRTAREAKEHSHELVLKNLTEKGIRENKIK